MLEDKSDDTTDFALTPGMGEGAAAGTDYGIPLDCHGISVPGRYHKVNQDDYLLTPLGTVRSGAMPDGEGPAFLFAVADGIGGGPAGDRASRLAIQTLHEFIRQTASQADVMRKLDPGELLKKGVLRCHEEIEADVAAHPELFGMGSTLTAALVIWPRAWVVHAGDSRCYRLRGDRLDRLTLDHTLVQRLSDEGVLTPETARRTRWKHALWNHLGKRSGAVDPELLVAELNPGDALLLTTDGITDLLPDREITALAGQPGTARSASSRIVQAAEAKGGRDDMTLVFARFAQRPGAPTQGGDAAVG